MVGFVGEHSRGTGCPRGKAIRRSRSRWLSVWATRLAAARVVAPMAGTGCVRQLVVDSCLQLGRAISCGVYGLRANVGWMMSALVVTPPDSRLGRSAAVGISVGKGAAQTRAGDCR